MGNFNRRQSIGFVASSTIAAMLPKIALAQEHSTLSGAGARAIDNLLTVHDHLQMTRRAADLQNLSLRAVFNTTDRVMLWHDISLETNALDYVKPAPNASTTDYKIQYGPHRSSRAQAIVQIAVFEAVNAAPKIAATSSTYASYTGLSPASGELSVDAAVAQAAHDALVALYSPTPSSHTQAARLDALLAQDLARISGTPDAIRNGSALGATAAQSILSKRANDASGLPEPNIPADYQPSGAVGEWSVDPISNIPLALGANWPKVTPFVLGSAAQFRAPPPPALTSDDYTAAYKLTKSQGGDPLNGTPTDRTDDNTFMAKFWSYDGTPGLCAPCRLYNQIARKIALMQGISDANDLARFLAIVNVAMADAGISAWEAKYHYKLWRPVVGIRRGGEDGNPNTDPDLNWYPLGAQITNTNGPNITPPFPAYPSGHATFGGALFQVLRSYTADSTSFDFVSDEFNGQNKDVNGQVRPYRQAHFASLADAEESNAMSRIWDGVHWHFDGQQGIAQGNAVANYILTRFAQKVA